VGGPWPLELPSLCGSPRILPILLSVVCLLAPAQAQHGGGGGHSGGGHFGGGHSSGRHSGGSHAGGHFGWLHFWSGRHSAWHAGFGASSTSDTSPPPPSHLWSPTVASMPSIPRIPSTLLWSPPLFPTRPDGKVSFVSSRVRPHRGFFFNRCCAHVSPATCSARPRRPAPRPRPYVWRFTPGTFIQDNFLFWYSLMLRSCSSENRRHLPFRASTLRLIVT
jgi:hypothetical protein